jgi:hypothetical protein
MNNTYSTGASSRTYSNLTAGLFASTLLAGVAMYAPQEQSGPPKPTAMFSGKAYEVHGVDDTGGQVKHALTGNLAGFANFEEQVTMFYTELLTKQSALGDDFSKVLHDNLWDLYSE